MHVRGIRGAITVEDNTADEILNNTRYLLEEIVRRNQIQIEDIVSCFFTVTEDLNAAYPAVAARQMGWTMVPLMCLNEMVVPGSLRKTIRVLLHVNTLKQQNEIKHVYLKDAKVLRPDLSPS